MDSTQTHNLTRSIIFYHQRKCGGTSMTRNLESLLGSGFKIQMHGKLLSSQQIKKAICMKSTLGVEEGCPDRYNLFFTGHTHENSACWKLLEEKHPGAYRFTLLRNPIERYLALYNFTKKSRFARMYLAPQQDYSLEEFLSDNTIHHFHDNMMVKSIASLGFGRDYSLPATRRDLEQAVKNLENTRIFQSFGVLKYFAAYYALVCDDFGLTPRTIIKWNVQPDPKKSDFDPQTIKKVFDKNRLDCELYDFAEQLFLDRLLTKLGSPKNMAAFISKASALETDEIVYMTRTDEKTHCNVC